jgi:hypothetical protein
MPDRVEFSPTKAHGHPIAATTTRRIQIDLDAVLQRRIAMADPAAAAACTEPAFEFENNDETENFNLRHRDDLRSPVPEAQRKISYDVYEARNVLKLLKEEKRFRTPETYNEFMRRVIQAGRAGCVAPYVDTNLASGALEQIRADIVRRVGTPLVYRYLLFLAGWALGGAVLGLIIVIIGHWALPAIEGYGWVLFGAMFGAWFSVAASRWQMAFETIPNYLDVYCEPLVRMLFVAIGAGAFALFLNLSVLTIKIGNTDFAGFTDPNSVGVAILLGFISGIGERALSVQLIERVQKVLNPSAS